MPFSAEDILGEFAEAACLGNREWFDGVRLSRNKRKRVEKRRPGTPGHARWRAAIEAWRRANLDRVKACRRKRRDKDNAYNAKWRALNPEAERAAIIRANRKRRERARIRKLVLAALVLHAVGHEGVARAHAAARMRLLEQKRAHYRRARKRLLNAVPTMEHV